MIRMFFILALFLIVSDDRWEKYTSSNEEIFYYDKKFGIKETTKDHFRLWSKAIPKPEFLEKIRNEKANLHKRLVIIDKDFNSAYDYGKWRSYSYSLQLHEVDCKNSSTNLISLIEYDSTGSVLASQDFPENWTNAVPETIGEELVNKVCHPGIIFPEDNYQYLPK
jgi:hypothetical protein